VIADGVQGAGVSLHIHARRNRAACHHPDEHRHASQPETDTLHVLDAHQEPPREVRRISVAGARGVEGVRSDDGVFVVWTARTLVRIATERPDAPIRVEIAMPGEISTVAVQP